MEKHSTKVVRAGEIIGVNVKDMEKKYLGEIKEIVLDKISGQVRYVVLSFGGFLGLGDKYFAFPWKAISYSPPDDGFVLNIDKSLLKKEKGFDKELWPDMAQWPESVDQYYNAGPSDPI